MATPKRDYDSTIARIAGNLMSGIPQEWLRNRDITVREAVATARAIVDETRRTEPKPETEPAHVG